jgi:hypothetical protein
MTIVAIPPWTQNGVLPPVNADDPVGAERSPYQVSLVDVVLRFGTSPERRNILEGFLNLRKKLHENGFVDGFHWIDGSFLEDVELIDKRPPADVDVVTFTSAPADLAVNQSVLAIFDHDFVKREYRVDHYFVELNLPSRQLIAQAAYWSSVWSHRRSMQWKGFLQVELDPSVDAVAVENLKTREREETAE